jgi:hypothetical protein
VTFLDGTTASESLGRDTFTETSSIASSYYIPLTSTMVLTTTRGHHIRIDLPTDGDATLLDSRPTIYLDQNHWSTVSNSIHHPDRVQNARELEAAQELVELAANGRVILPMPSAHMAETCKQVDPVDRYNRALTITQLSAGWQLRDPLAVRRIELRQALTLHAHHTQLVMPACVTLESNAIHISDGSLDWEPGADLPEEAQRVVRTLAAVGGNFDVMLDREHIPMTLVPGWAIGMQNFASFLAANPTGPELKRRRTHAKLIADLGNEIPDEAHAAGLTPEQMSEWTLNRSEADIRDMPSLGVYRELFHEKVSNPLLRWHDNDLIDMVYLSAAAGYCDHVAGERSHSAHIVNAIRRLDRKSNVHSNLDALLATL